MSGLIVDFRNKTRKIGKVATKRNKKITHLLIKMRSIIMKYDYYGTANRFIKFAIGKSK